MVVFIQAHAATHWLSPQVAAVMRSLDAAVQALSAHELASALHVEQDGFAELLQRLQEMESLGLVQRAPVAR